MNIKNFDELTDSEKQTMTEEFISNFTIINQNTVVEYILSKSWEDSDAPFCFDDITNNEPRGTIAIGSYYLELTEDERDEKLEFYERLRDKAHNIYDHFKELLNKEVENEEYETLKSKLEKALNILDKYKDVCDDMESMDFDNHPEIFQWFECDGYLIRKLEGQGECILDDTYWGRQCCGQSIVLDHVIQKIAYDHYINTPTNCLPNRVDFLLSQKEVA